MSRTLASAGLGLALVVALAAPARADEPAVAGTGTGRVYGSSTTILMMREVLDPRDPSTVLYQAPFYEYVTLGGDDLGTPGFSFHVTGFGGVNATAAKQMDQVWRGTDWTDASRFSGDVLVGTLEYHTPKNLFYVRAGRQVLYEGAGANVMMDGVYVRVRPDIALEVSAFGGWVPYPQFDYQTGRAVYGGRVAYNPWDWGRIGVSYVEERQDLEGESTRSRSNLGIDYDFRRWRQFELTGALVVDLIGRGLQENRTYATVNLDEGVSLTVDYGLFNPSALIPKTSIFSVFNNSHYHALGLDVNYRGNGWMGIDGYFRWFFYGGGDNGYQAGLKPTLTFGKGKEGMVGVEAVRVKNIDNGYWEARAFGTYRPHPAVDLTANVENYFYDSEFKGYQRSHIVGITAGWEAFKGGRIQGDFLVTVNPEFAHSLTGMIKFTYAFSANVK